MYIVNDIEFILKLSKYKILDYIIANCTIAISRIRLLDYTYRVRQAILGIKEIQILSIDDDFNNWILGKRKFLSVSDLSTIYVANNSDKSELSIVVITPEDESLIRQIKENDVKFIMIDEFIIKIIKNERVIKLYNLIKAA